MEEQRQCWCLSSSSSSLLDFPPELMAMILSYCTAEDLRSVRLVHSRLSYIVQHLVPTKLSVHRHRWPYLERVSDAARVGNILAKRTLNQLKCYRTRSLGIAFYGPLPPEIQTIDCLYLVWDRTTFALNCLFFCHKFQLKAAAPFGVFLVLVGGSSHLLRLNFQRKSAVLYSYEGCCRRQQQRNTYNIRRFLYYYNLVHRDVQGLVTFFNALVAHGVIEPMSEPDEIELYLDYKFAHDVGLLWDRFQ